MITFVTVTVLMSAVFYNSMDCGKILVACGSIICPILSIGTAYGVISLIGIRTNSFMLVMPFLIMGIGTHSFFHPIYFLYQKYRDKPQFFKSKEIFIRLI